jgi:hypothetical protein
VTQLVSGDEVMYYDVQKKKSTSIKTGKYLYIEPVVLFNSLEKEMKKSNWYCLKLNNIHNRTRYNNG